MNSRLNLARTLTSIQPVLKSRGWIFSVSRPTSIREASTSAASCTDDHADMATPDAGPFRRWWFRSSRDDVLECEKRLWASVPVPVHQKDTPFSPTFLERSAENIRHPSSNGAAPRPADHWVHSLSAWPTTVHNAEEQGVDNAEKQQGHLVLFPGYAMPAGSFAGAMRHAVEKNQSHPRFQSLHAVDWAGGGLSSRPDPEQLWGPSSERELSDEENERVKLVEKFFVDGLEQWREQNDIERFTLVGHSMGGYLAVAYCERHPERVDHLVLASPCGIPTPPSEAEMEARLEQAPWRWRMLLKAGRSVIWDRDVTPQSILRFLGYPLGGRTLARKWTEIGGDGD